MSKVNELEIALEAGYGHGQADAAAELAEAREIIGAAHDYLSCDWFPHKSRNGNDKAAIESRARTFLNKNKSA